MTTDISAIASVGVQPLPNGGVAGKSERVRIAELVRAGSPRSSGEDEAHIQRLVEAEGPLPPILVHRASMRIIDGFHRVSAALRAGVHDIEAYFVEGAWESAFVLAVQANISHGLPLSLGDRRNAAAKILQGFPHWSDRAVAGCTGLSAKTVSTIRCATADGAQLHKRLGKDGRVRPLNAAVGRQLAAQLLALRPQASLREIGEAAGISAGTVRDVRARLSRGEDPLPPPRSANPDTPGGRGAKPSTAPKLGAGAPADVKPVLVTLSRDPALCMTAAGRELLRWLHLHAVNTMDSAQIVQSVPDHCVEHLIELANRCSANWAHIASDLAQRSQAKPPSNPARTHQQSQLPSARCS